MTSTGVDSRLEFRDLLNETIALWPEHERFLTRALSVRTPDEHDDADCFAGLIHQIAGSRLPSYIQSYRWMCEEFLAEQLHFSRTGAYRFSSLEDVRGSVYGQPEYMTRYMDGLLISQAFWNNHLKAASILRRRFLANNQPGYRHLEIGPGHGLFMYFAAASGQASSLSAWDISETSLQLTRNCLRRLGVQAEIEMLVRDASVGQVGRVEYDSIVLSEILEHVEMPHALLGKIAQCLSSGGRIFVNVPVNSPAPDHLFLLNSPEEALELVRNAGLKVVESYFLPEGNLTLEQAAKRKATVSCVIIAER